MGALTGLVARVRDPRFDRVLLFGWIAMFSVARAGRFEERDPYWQVRAGLENLSGAPLARPDTWSWSGVPGDWYQNSVGWNNVLAVSYQAAGYWGIFALTAVMIAVYLSLVALLGSRLGARTLPGMAGMVVVIAGALSMISPRATLVVQVIILGSVALADWWARRFAAGLPGWVSAAFALAAATGLSALGNWMHLSFLTMTPVLMVMWAVVWWWGVPDRARRLWLVAAGSIGWGLGLLASPFGVALGVERTRIVQDICQGLILEWASPFAPAMDPKVTVTVLLGVALALAILVWLIRRFRAGATGPQPVLLSLALLGLPASFASLWAVRFLGIGLLTLAPVVALAATDLVDALRRTAPFRPPSRWAEYGQGGFWRPVLTGVSVVLLPGALWLGSLHSVPVEQPLVDELPHDCLLMNSQTSSGPVILSRPDVEVWIDGRADFFGRDHIITTYAYYAGTMPTIVPPGTTCVLLQNDVRLGMSQRLADSPDWRLADRIGVFELWLPARG